VNPEDRKGILARATAWMQSLRAEWETSAGKCYIIVLGATVLIAGAQLPGSGLVPPLVIFGIGWVIAYLLKYSISAAEKLRAVRYALLAIAFQECCCKPNSIVTEAPGAPELVGKPIGKGYCHVCKCREILEEYFPGAIEELMQERLNDFAFEETYIPEDLAASYITPEALAYLRERRLDRVGPERFVPLTFTVRKLRK
jgi:hypothetical protein